MILSMAGDRKRLNVWCHYLGYLMMSYLKQRASLTILLDIYVIKHGCRNYLKGQGFARGHFTSSGSDVWRQWRGMQIHCRRIPPSCRADATCSQQRMAGSMKDKYCDQCFLKGLMQHMCCKEQIILEAIKMCKRRKSINLSKIDSWCAAENKFEHLK